MTINTKNIVSITEANQNFSKVARLVDENGAAVILKNNVPRYLVLEFSQAQQEEQADEESLRDISRRLIAKTERPMRIWRNENSIPPGKSSPVGIWNRRESRLSGWEQANRRSRNAGLPGAQWHRAIVHPRGIGQYFLGSRRWKNGQCRPSSMGDRP